MYILCFLDLHILGQKSKKAKVKQFLYSPEQALRVQGS